ncbi:MAG: hypothetical protein LN416_06465 [Candidatus Thermoplasmatota archaeon]|nr:hypothetical protein [Candidatus Thermoplasmatota archaeon]
MKRIVAVFVCLLFLASALGASAVVLAGKPDKCEPWPECRGGGGDPPPEGAVYFWQYGGEGKEMWTMKADGSEKTKLGIYPGIDQSWEDFGALSRLEHGGHHWFLRFEVVGGSYPSGQWIRELFAVRDDGTVEVQLTDDPALETFNYGRALDWGIDDNTVTWSAKRWGDDPIMPEEFGIFSAGISFDANGDVIGLSEEPTLIWDTGYHYYPPRDYYIPNVKRFDWSPDGTQLVVAKWQHDGWNYKMFIVDLATQTETDLGTSGYKVSWSPDGSKIAFIQSFDLRTINPDGTNEQILVEPIYRGRDRYVNNERIDWSPDSNHLTYSWIVWIKDRPPLDIDNFVYRVDVNSGDKTCMTDDLDDAFSHSWR